MGGRKEGRGNISGVWKKGARSFNLNFSKPKSTRNSCASLALNTRVTARLATFEYSQLSILSEGGKWLEFSARRVD